MHQKRRREDSPEFNEHDMKFAGAKASAGVVSIITHDVPAEIIEKHQGKKINPPPKEIIFSASGIIIECQSPSSKRRKYLCTVLAPACLFCRPNHVNLHTIKIDVFGPGGVLYNGKLLACDFHYNLAAITFKSRSPLQTVTLKHIDDTLSIDPTHHIPEMPFQLRPHSTLFNIVPGTEVFSVSRSHGSPYGLYPSSGFFSSRCPEGFSCGELYEIKDSIYCPDFNGGSVLNAFGEIIGIIFNRSSFLPSNVMTRWWKHYKTFKEFRHPFLGIEVGNLYDADLDFLEQFIIRFPNISTAVIITKVEEDSPASRSGIRTNDVIIKLDGKLVKSKSKYFETIWEKAGKSVEFSILRVPGGEELNLNLLVEEANSDKYHKWPLPGWNTVD